MNTTKLQRLLGHLRDGGDAGLEEGMGKYSAYWVKQLPTDLMTQVMRTVAELGGETDRYGVTTRDGSQMTTGKVHTHEASLGYQVPKNPNAKLLKAFMGDLRKWGLKKTESKAQGKKRVVRFEGPNKERVNITFEYQPNREWGWVNVEAYDARSSIHEDEIIIEAKSKKPSVAELKAQAMKIAEHVFMDAMWRKVDPALRMPENQRSMGRPSDEWHKLQEQFKDELAAVTLRHLKRLFKGA